MRADDLSRARSSSKADPDPVHPRHYSDLKPEPIDVIEAWRLGFCLGNAIKYIARAGRKDPLLQDLKKARWYLDRQIASLEAAHGKD